MGLKCPTWMPTGRWSWSISCRAGFKRGQLPRSCTPLIPVAQKTRDNSGTSPSNRLHQLGLERQQRADTLTLIRRIHTRSSHHAPHQCSDSAEEWIMPMANSHPSAEQHHPPRRLPPTHQQHKRHQRQAELSTTIDALMPSRARCIATEKPRPLQKCKKQRNGNNEEKRE